MKTKNRIQISNAFLLAFTTLLFAACGVQQAQNIDSSKGNTWTIESQEDWQANIAEKSNLEISEGKVIPTEKEAVFKSSMKKFTKKKSAKSITFSQSAEWLNWEQIPTAAPANLGDAPVALQLGDGNYWMFGKYDTRKKNKRPKDFKSKDTTLIGYDVVLKTTHLKNQFDAPAGLKKTKKGYHAWHSIDMKNWVHYGPISDMSSRWVTSAEYIDGKFYFYYDFPNDQDPHLLIDENLTDGLVGKKMGMAFKDPSDGSDCAVIRDLDGNFHIIAEDWSPIDASTHAWDSPLATHAVSKDGFNDFKILNPAVDERTKPTGKFAEYAHPHWFKEDPDNYPGKASPVDIPRQRIKKGDVVSFGKYEIHEPEQNSFGDWASISIGGQYYLFADYDPAGKTGGKHMSVAWFTSDNINKQFEFCGNIGQGHPDPDIMFAEGKYYLLTQTRNDYVSSGPWVETVKVRMGVDTTNDGLVNEWSDWQVVKEQYDYIKGFSKQIEKTPAQMNFSDLPKGYGFQFEVKMTDTTENESKPILDKVVVSFDK